jgi:uncharacterized protein (TIGR00369 family)
MVGPMARNMDRWLGDGGMPIVTTLGAAFRSYGPGWCELDWTPTDLACNPFGGVQAGVFGILLDASMNFAINSSLEGKDTTRATLEMKTELIGPVKKGDTVAVRGEVVRAGKQIAYAQSLVTAADGSLLTRGTATFLLTRQ